jgi:hypothetical protein
VNKPPRNHHFVPASLLRYFSIRGLEKQIHVFEKRTDKAFTAAIENAGSENDFNKLKTPDGEWNFEPLFDEIDGALHALLQQIHTARSVASLSHDERAAWADIVATQIIRTPLARTSLIQVASDLAASIEEAGLAGFDAFVLPTENDARRTSVEMLLEREPFCKAVQEKDFVLYEPSGAARFWTSDHPVILESSVSYGDRGLAAPGIAIYFPLGPDLLLGMLCKSIAASLNARAIELLDLDPQQAAHIIALRQGLLSGLPIPCPDDWVDAVNRRQIIHSGRFVYSHEDACKVIAPFLERHPDFRKVTTYVHVGRMGEGPGPSSQMPGGLWLVLFGKRTHYMIKVNEWSDETFPQLSIDDGYIEAMNRALEDGPFSEMTVYEDRAPRRMMRDVLVEIVSVRQPTRIRIRHSDPLSDPLAEAIEGHGRADS